MLQAADLAVFRGERLVFSGKGLRVAQGGALLLRGPNGAGKSSLLRALAGLTPCAAGRVLWEGANVLEDLAEHGARIGWLGHQDAVKPALTVGEQVADAAALAALGLAGFTGLPARYLSAGQKRRLAIARVVAARRPLWLLDEPGNGLDTASAALLGAAFAAHRAAGGMIVASTHAPLALPDAEVLEL